LIPLWKCFVSKKQANRFIKHAQDMQRRIV
jgi:hypothetical protein